MFWLGVLGLIMAVPAVSAEYIFKDRPMGAACHLFDMDWKLLGLMVAASCGDTLGVTTYTIAFQSDKASFVSLLSYISVLYAYLGDMLIFNERFKWIQLLAATMILTTTVLTSVVKLYKSNNANKQDDSVED